MPRYLTYLQEAVFPNLNRQNYRVTSPATGTYNCIAHASANDNRWWWPSGLATFWPLPSGDETLQAFEAAFATLGFRKCRLQSVDVEPGVERVALYIDAAGVPTHAARQLPTGKWSSKLGAWEDIEHDTLEAVADSGGNGLGYGTVAVILCREKKKS